MDNKWIIKLPDPSKKLTMIVCKWTAKPSSSKNKTACKQHQMILFREFVTFL